MPEGLEEEARQITEFLDSAHGLMPYRTEFPTWWACGGVPVAAGMVDALFVNGAGEFVLVDWKCVATPMERSSGTGSGLARHLPDSTFSKYSLQASLYSEMLRHSHDIDVGSRMMLVVVHASQESHRVVKCMDLRAEARAILSEMTRDVTDGYHVPLGKFDFNRNAEHYH